MPLKRTAALAVSSLIVLGGGATALAATGTFSAATDAPAPPIAAIATAAADPSAVMPAIPSSDAIGDLLGDITVDPDTGAITGHGFTLQPPVTAPDGSATFSGTGPDGQSHSATITPGADGGRPTITIDGQDLGSMLDGLLGQLPDPSTLPAMPQLPPISIPPQVQQFLDQARSAVDGMLGGSMPQWPGQPRA